MPDTVVTRFAPSPTGYLHIGGARTALFNWLYARHTGGTMLLRIEDTDRERSTEAATARDSRRADLARPPLGRRARSRSSSAASRHREVAEELVRARQGLLLLRHPRRARPRCARTATRRRAARRATTGAGATAIPRRRRPASKAAVRIKAPQDGETIVHDRVQGDVRFPNKDLDDFIILRSDGMPTYMHAVVVDDHDMGVTHIIRGDDHLTNAARQQSSTTRWAGTVPVMAHIPLIHGADGAKLSKRHGALGVDAYRAMGYLPAALRNYLARLGWSHGDDEMMASTT